MEDDRRAGGNGPWSRDSQCVLRDTGSGERGLSEDEAAARLRQVGPNRLRAAPSISVWRVAANQLESIIIVLLLVASALSFAVGDIIEGAAIAVTIGITIALGFITELRAVRSMEALRRLGAVRARVRRDGLEREVDAATLVPGDVVLFEGGDRVTADARVIEASKLQADESALTGESVPIAKTTAPVAPHAPLADRTSMLYKGATITRGAGAGVVVGTGMATELGRIAALVEDADHEETPLERRLAALGRKLLWLCLVVATLTVVVGIARGRGVMLMLETGIALAIAAIPEGLPVVATIALARGMWRLSARHALIRRLSAVETLGATSVIVTDKTGTLTENRLSVVALAVGEREVRLDDALADAEVADDVLHALEIGALCNNASLAGASPSGDPLEIALLRAAAKAEIHPAQLATELPEVREEAFDSELKMMATVHRADDGYLVAVKGAPESVLEVCARPAGDDARRRVLAASEDMARRGLRVLAVADKRVGDPSTPVYDDLHLVGLIGLADPPRREVAAPLAACRDAGIRVIMATGDQPATAAAIAREVGLTDGSEVEVVHGADLTPPSRLTDAERRRLRDIQVFARVTPEQKLDIIDLHQQSGAVVAMTGDGVNDAPALNKAEIGIAMGARGTEVAREAAAMVLRDDSFESIVVAVEQGRAIFENLRRFVIYLLSCNLSEILIVTGAVVIGAPLPLLPLQILFLNLVTDVFPALALGFGQGDPGAMRLPPRDAREPIVARRHWLVIVGHALVITLSVLGAMGVAYALGASRAQATTVSFLALGFAQLWHVFNMRGRHTRVLANDVVQNPWVWGALGLCVALLLAFSLLPPLASVLGVTELGARLWGLVMVSSLVPLVVGQALLKGGKA